MSVMGLRKKAMANAHSHNDAGGAIGILVAFGLVVMGILLCAGLVLPSAIRLFGIGDTASSGADLAVISAALSTVVVALAAFRPSRAMSQNDGTTTTNTPSLTTTTVTGAATGPVLSPPPIGPTIEVDVETLDDGRTVLLYLDTTALDSLATTIGWLDPKTGVYTPGNPPTGGTL
jgi:hypothetical protein